MKTSLLQDLFGLVKHGSPTLFRSPKGFFKFIDALPGVPFHHNEISLEGTPPYPFAWRSVVDVVRHLMEQHNGGFLDPLDAEIVANPTDFIHGQRFRRLNKLLLDHAGQDALLMPIILNSGATSDFTHIAMLLLLSCWWR